VSASIGRRVLAGSSGFFRAKVQKEAGCLDENLPQYNQLEVVDEVVDQDNQRL
jgi:hypothetical protein